ncbi:hypothetical protein BJX64DRAFT_77282 [Aspergillus heterothallicus]
MSYQEPDMPWDCLARSGSDEEAVYSLDCMMPIAGMVMMMEQTERLQIHSIKSAILRITGHDSLQSWWTADICSPSIVQVLGTPPDSIFALALAQILARPIVRPHRGKLICLVIVELCWLHLFQSRLLVRLAKFWFIDGRLRSCTTFKERKDAKQGRAGRS